MSSIESNNQSLNNILEKIGVKSPEGASPQRKSSLGQEDFLKLMTRWFFVLMPFNESGLPRLG